MQVYVRKNGHSSKITVNKSDSIRTLKEKVSQKKDIPPDNQVLVFDGKRLEDEHIISYYNIKQESIIQLCLRVHEGPSFSFSFNDLKDKLLKDFSTSAPDYRTCYYGLNLEAQCNTNSCRAYGLLVWVPLEFGNFNIAREMNRTKCPICKQKTKPAINIGYYNTLIKVQGKQRQTKRQIRS